MVHGNQRKVDAAMHSQEALDIELCRMHAVPTVLPSLISGARCSMHAAMHSKDNKAVDFEILQNA